MRICVISDLHANYAALAALPRDYDELWVLGDLVNYGPEPAATIDFVRANASVVIRGNHDHAVGYDADCGCSPRFRTMAEATRDYTATVISAADRQYLRDLPTSLRREADGKCFYLCHATPADQLYEYRKPDYRYGINRRRPAPARTSSCAVIPICSFPATPPAGWS